MKNDERELYLARIAELQARLDELKPAGVESLSQRQRDASAAYEAHGSAKGAAKAMGISHHTVKDYLEQAYKRLGCRGIAQACAMVARYEAASAGA